MCQVESLYSSAQEVRQYIRQDADVFYDSRYVSFSVNYNLATPT